MNFHEFPCNSLEALNQQIQILSTTALRLSRLGTRHGAETMAGELHKYVRRTWLPMGIHINMYIINNKYKYVYIILYIYIHIIEMYMVQKIANFTKPNPQFHMHESYKITQPLWKNRH
jgi:hypothetical protein